MTLLVVQANDIMESDMVGNRDFIAGNDDETAATTDMHPIEMEGGEASFPASEEHRASMGLRSAAYDHNKIGKRGILLLLVLSSLFVLIVIVPVIALSKKDRSSRSSSAAARPRPTFDDVVEYLVKEEISSDLELRDPSSFRYKAAKWMAEEDPANEPIPGSDITLVTGYRYMARYIMALNFFAMGGESWINQWSWLSELDVCAWNFFPLREGVFCHRTQSGIPIPVYLHLNQNNVVGTIPEENGKLSTLFSFQMQNNRVSGSIPSELWNLPNLHTLALNFNNLTGKIPNSEASNLLELFLHYNDLTGVIPSELCKSSHLSHLRLNNLGLTGAIPACLGDLDLWLLFLQNNALEGELPATFASAKNMTIFMIDDNMFTGNPTAIFSALPNLKLLMANDNEFTGDVDDSFMAEKLESLRVMDLSHNNFTSPDGIPAHLLAFPQLVALDISVNQLAGELPSEIAANDVLGYLSLYGNDLKGELPPDLKNLVVLNHLDLNSNSFVGPIIDEIAEMPKLQFLFLSENDFEPGKIPSTFASMTSMREFSLRNTQRSGPLPAYISGWTSLGLLDLGDNDLTGVIPDAYGQLIGLEYLLLNNNSLTDEIPSTFGHLESLTAAYLDGNDLVGSVDVLCGLPKLQTSTGKDFIFADCGGAFPALKCTCSCHCCTPDVDDGCSRPNIANLDGSWENMFRRVPWEEYDFGNETVIDNDKLPADS